MIYCLILQELGFPFTYHHQAARTKVLCLMCQWVIYWMNVFAINSIRLPPMCEKYRIYSCDVLRAGDWVVEEIDNKIIYHRISAPPGGPTVHPIKRA